MSNIISLADLTMAVLRVSRLDDCKTYSTKINEENIYSVRFNKERFTFPAEGILRYLQSLGIVVYGLSVNDSNELVMLVDFSRLDVKYVSFNIIEEWAEILLNPHLKSIRFVGADETNSRRNKFNARFQIRLLQNATIKFNKFVAVLKSLGLTFVCEEDVDNTYLLTIRTADLMANIE